MIAIDMHDELMGEHSESLPMADLGTMFRSERAVRQVHTDMPPPSVLAESQLHPISRPERFRRVRCPLKSINAGDSFKPPHRR